MIPLNNTLRNVRGRRSDRSNFEKSTPRNGFAVHQMLSRGSITMNSVFSPRLSTRIVPL
jgi:hypothetical protein